MLITQIKKKEELIPFLKGKILLISCFGCYEAYFPVNELNEFKTELKNSGVNVINELIFDYLCNEEFTRKRVEKYGKQIDEVDTLLVFSCGVGVQMLASLIPKKVVVSGCDTFYLPAFAGVTPLEYDCEQCGECMLGLTLGICPLTACSKGLLNGPCGGAKNGKCEVSKDMECGWQRILNRIKDLNELNRIKDSIKLRDYSK